MRQIIVCFAAFSLIVPVPVPVLACLWDRETTFMSNQVFPNVYELITGNFIRHSPSYYEWRLKERSSKKTEDRTPEDYDDIAVSYEKLGQQEKAIEIIQEKIKRWPEKNRYESEANLGTFYIHSGDFEKGLAHIEKAIEINPDAHFGREIYQKLVVEYVLQQRAAGATLPLEKESVNNQNGFVAFVLAAQKIPEDKEIQRVEIETAIRGIVGMMRFGHHDSPVLLEVLGDLILTREHSWYRQSAADAYLKASYETDDAEVAELYRQKAEQAIPLESDSTLAELEEDLKRFIAKGEGYYTNISQKEKYWIENDKDVELEFQKLFFSTPEVNTGNSIHNQLQAEEAQNKMFLIAICILVLFGFGFLLWFYIPRSKRK